MPEITDRIATELQKHRPSMLRVYPAKCRCGTEYTDWHIHLANVVAETLCLTQEWAVSSGDGRDFEKFETLDAAERGLHCAVTNNEYWQRQGRDTPIWARDPHIETHWFTRWERTDA